MQLSDFTFDLRRNLAPTKHLWVGSGWSTVRPVTDTVMGVGECFAPPFAARGFGLSMSLKVNDREIADTGSRDKGDVGLLYAGGSWQPDRIIRQGTYHQRHDGELISLAVTSELVPLTNRCGFSLIVNVTNRGADTVELRVIPELDPGAPAYVPLDSWLYSPPAVGRAARQASHARWSNNSVAITLAGENLGFSLDPGGSDQAMVPVIFSAAETWIEMGENPNLWHQETREAWDRRLERAAKNLPMLESDIPGLADYYRRSIASGLVCIWENPAFANTPMLTTSGLDGGGICTYAWDLGGYITNTAALMLGDSLIDIARTLHQIGFDQYYAYAPDGSGIGVSYAYSVFSFVNLVRALAAHFGLDESLFQAARDLVLAAEADAPEDTLLVDYGYQHNLLEMRATGWEHVVASPNAERAWCLEQIADFADHLGTGDPSDQWRDRATTIRQAVRDQLWDEDAGWFVCRFPDGHVERVYSIQVFDALAAGACTPAMTEAVLSHLREGAFLGEYGVSSISAEDRVHYELNDPDWSGSGAFIGDGPQLVLALYELGESVRAWDILKRFFWMGHHLPYYPQEHMCDRPATPANKRANNVAGLAGAEAILFGLLGFQPQVNGDLWINPQPPEQGSINVEGFGFRGHQFDVQLTSDQCRVTSDGREVYAGPPKRVRLDPTHS